MPDTTTQGLPRRLSEAALLTVAALAAAAGWAAQQAAASPQAVGKRAPPVRDGQGAQPAAPWVDAFGDPLPPGARLRLGTTRFRHVGEVYCLAFMPDGTTLASCGWGT